MGVLSVLLPLPLGPMSYLPPFGFAGEALGRRVAVPWRGEVRVGVVVEELPAEARPSLRHAVALLDEKPFLRPQEIAFLKEAARYLFAPEGLVLMDLLPPFPPLEHRVRLLPEADPGLLPPGLEALSDWQEARGFDPKLLDLLRENGVLEEEVRFRRPNPALWLHPAERDGPLSEEEERAYRALLEMGQARSMAELARKAGVSVRVVQRLLKRGVFRLAPARRSAEPVEPLLLPELPGRINGGRLPDRLRLLGGLIQGKRALVLFPEVALLEAYLRHFPEAYPLHGGLSVEERARLFEDPPGQVFATYQGLLLPADWDLIVVVEEGSESYKLSSGSRAFIPPLAELRARLLGVPLVYLGQVPSVEVLDRPGYTFPVPRPRLHLVDLNRARGWPFTGEAWALLRQVEARGRQALVLSGRKGYSALLRCRDCGYKPMCPHCALPLRYHEHRLLCHQCGHEEPPPPLCPRCGSDLIEPRGPGLDWLYKELKEKLSLPVFRLSRDKRDDLEPLLRGEPGVLVATTLVLRGPLLPDLALVLLPYADGFIYEGDFRAQERYHRLLWALTELHPARRPLLALQTFEPDHPVHQGLLEGSVEAYLHREKALREALDYPPKTRMLKLEVAHPKEPVARERALALAEALKGEEGVMGPAPAPVPRVKGRYVFHLLLRGSTERLAALLARLDSRWYKLDPDPLRFVGLLED
jgi:primosomal protein N' (replication factor Y)